MVEDGLEFDDVYAQHETIGKLEFLFTYFKLSIITNSFKLSINKFTKFYLFDDRLEDRLVSSEDVFTEDQDNNLL